MKVFKFSGLIDDTDRNVCNEFIGYFILQEHGEIIGVMKGKKEQSVIKGWFSNKKLFFTEVTGKKHSRRTGHYRSIHGYHFKDISSTGWYDDDGLFADGPWYIAIIEVVEKDDQNAVLAKEINKLFQFVYKRLEYEKYELDEAPTKAKNISKEL